MPSAIQIAPEKAPRNTAATAPTVLGAYLRDRRTKLDPAALGFPAGRRRTPGLRREEVAARAHISPTWYAWLEQGRGGAPSAETLSRIAAALMLTDVEREHLFLLGLGRPPEVRYRPADGVSPRLQRVLDSFELCPALIKTALWDVIAWNRAALAVLADYELLPPGGRNILRLLFTSPHARDRQTDWATVARHVVAAFRAEAARAGASEAVAELVAELSAASPEFADLWAEHDVVAPGEGVKRLRLPGGAVLGLEYSSFAVDGRPDLAMVVYAPATSADAARIQRILDRREAA
ncbi:MAG TPA: helix-turn-helix transcriptional regulator [Caulobacteraceae bacterium]|jgi:transcriptional regulator with XRE-family HTH domain